MPPDIASKVAAFFEQYEVRSYQNGHILIHAGDNPEGVLNIVSGKVKQYDLTNRGDEVILNVFKAPSFFPMSYAINRTPNEYFFEADSDVEIRQAPLDDIVDFLRNNPDVLYDLMGRVYLGVDGLLRRMAELMAGTARNRVIYELIIESARFGKKQDDQFLIDLNESDIAARAGLTRETVNREMQKLKNNGLILIEKKRIIVVSLNVLKQSLGKG
jgi:CRP-like cAMP-binding protein